MKGAEMNGLPKVDMMQTGERIAELRLKNNMTVKDLQKLFEFNTPQAIYKWMRGETMPTVDNLVILADAFHVSIADIVVVTRT